jgi:hypothetical protein
MAIQLTGGLRRGVKPCTVSVYLLAVVLAVASPLHAFICSTFGCSAPESHCMAKCQGMEMPKQSGHSWTAPTLPCCQQDQTPSQTVQRDDGSRGPDGTTAQIVPENLSAVTIGTTTTVSHQLDGSPPDRQSLFCTFVI